MCIAMVQMRLHRIINYFVESTGHILTYIVVIQPQSYQISKIRGKQFNFLY